MTIGTRRAAALAALLATAAGCGGGGGAGTPKDTTSPTVIAVTPTQGAGGVATDTVVQVTFSEAMAPQTIHAQSFGLSGGGGHVGAESVAYDPVAHTATLRPASALSSGTEYTVALTAEVTDASGNALAPFTSTFTTAAGGLWSGLATTGAPDPRYRHTAVWTGSRMIVWGGITGPTVNTGGAYDPVADGWTATATTGAPEPRSGHTAVWTGSRMVIWGGAYGTHWDRGGRYDPAADAWASTSLVNAPSPRREHTAVWTGSRMIVWGGRVGSDASPTPMNDGAPYDPTADAWAFLTTTGAPPARYQHTAVWTGSKMIVWGGTNGVEVLDSGGVYDPASNTWTPTSTQGAPAARRHHAAVWDGVRNRMIVWGGERMGNGSRFADGAMYDPASDTWAPMSTTSAPLARSEAVAVWTGSRLVLWGGYGSYAYLADGAIYDPALDRWSPLVGSAAPSPRGEPRGVWTGSRMLVWGGYNSTGGPVGTGGSYAP
jgi:N-acetylneuraminic acid mutarotase